MTSRVYDAPGARSPRSHYDVILIVTSFAAELHGHAHRYGRTVRTNERTYGRTDTLPRLIYRDICNLFQISSFLRDIARLSETE